MIIGELQSMGINSMLSGPKTQARAFFGTGTGTVTKPVAAMIGAGLAGDARMFRASAAAVGAMFESIPEAFRKAVADFQTFTSDNIDPRNLIMNTKQKEFDRLLLHKTVGTPGEKQMFAFALAALCHKSPFLNYGPRLMVPG